MEHFLGVHISRRHPDCCFCLLNQALEVRTLEKGHLDEALFYVSAEDTRITAVDAPARVNAGLMQREDCRADFDPPPAINRWMDLRYGEYELVSRQMRGPRTPSQKGACPQWMQRGIDFHALVSQMGYVPYPSNGGKVCMEVPGEAAFQSMLGIPLLAGETTEGRIQRQLLLWRMGVQVEDPMLTFEEVTRFRLERGKFPYLSVLETDQLLAMMAAFVAWLSVRRPEDVQTFGREEEGFLVVPRQLIQH